MFKNIGVVLKKNASLDERSVVQDLITVLAKNALNIFAEEGANLSLAIEKNNEDFKHQIDLQLAFGGEERLLEQLGRLFAREFRWLGKILGTLAF